ncbi:MAG: helix-hairpin-helix domain-containing protein [Campylobacter sp.]|nr:helix-hairpin-helix domain-containing protein [Campylobacter sp.]
MKIFKFFIAMACIINFVFADVDLNTASKKELMDLGFNKNQALNIIKYRKAHKFKNINELTNVKGIKFSQVEKVKDKILVAKDKNKKK